MLEKSNIYKNTIRSILDPLIPCGSPLALIDFPNYSNVGDSAIWLGQQAYLNERHPKSKIVWVSDSALMQSPLPKLPDGTTILIQGGGNFGDLWPLHQKLRERIVDHYASHKIIQMPQSIHFTSFISANESKCIFSKHKDFHLLVRDKKSLDFANNQYDCHVCLCPDMALYLGKLKRIQALSPIKVLLLLRTDKETRIKQEKQDVNNFFHTEDWINEPHSISKVILSKIDHISEIYPNYDLVPSWLKYLIYNKIARERLIHGCNLLARHEVVITDRLHGHILSTLMDIPHFVLDNFYSKIRNFREAWNTGEGICHEVNTLDEAIELSRTMISKHTYA